MKKTIIETKVEVYTFDELDKNIQELISRAKKLIPNAYVPYSHFHVGAAVLLENGEIFAGNNQENAAYPSSLCAERVTLFYANAQYPDIPVKSIAIVGFTQNDFLNEPITPCGGCRQVLLEAENRFGKDIAIYLYGKRKIYKIDNVKGLLPLSFGKEDLQLE